MDKLNWNDVRWMSALTLLVGGLPRHNCTDEYLSLLHRSPMRKTGQLFHEEWAFYHKLFSDLVYT